MRGKAKEKCSRKQAWGYRPGAEGNISSGISTDEG